MPPSTKFLYYITSRDNPVSEELPIWNKPMAMTRDFDLSRPGDNEKPFVSVGDYFLAARLFFETSGIEYIVVALKQRFEKQIDSEDIDRIDIFLVKHGEFYHPARIEVSIHEKRIYFVLNVAISQAGKEHIEGEYRCLKKLNKDYSFGYLPQVYGWHDVEIANDFRVPMFLAEWLNNYHEFHISRNPGDGKNEIIVWDSGRGPYFLTESQSLDLYTRAAGILTGYYNLESFEQINAWHHAAGDFIVRVENEKLDLKLITVRRYAPLFEKSFLDDPKILRDSPEFILQALLLFFLNLSLKMRLDRIDGVGDIVWADDQALQGTLIGFLNALGMKGVIPALPDTPLRCFFQYLSMCSKTDFYELSESLLNRLNPDSPEIDVIKRHLDNHIDSLLDCLHNL